jgi:SAM-dependent methyltransferase
MTPTVGIACAGSGRPGYVAGLVPWLRDEDLHVRLYVPEGPPPEDASGTRPITALADDAPDVVVYEVFDAPECAPVLQSALEGPQGIVALPDSTVHRVSRALPEGCGAVEEHGGRTTTIHRLRVADVAGAAPSGPWADAVAFCLDLLGPLLTRHMGAIVPTRSAASGMAVHSRDIQTFVVPQFAAPPKPANGSARDGFTLGALGPLTPACAGQLLDALAAVRARGADARLVLLGTTDHASVAAMAAERGLAGLVSVHGAVGPDAMHGALARLDAVVSIGFPVPGTGPLLALALSAGVPIVGHAAGVADAPPPAVLPLDADSPMLPGLVRVLGGLASDPSLRSTASAAARAFGTSHLHPNRCAHLVASAVRGTLRAGVRRALGVEERNAVAKRRVLAGGPELFREALCVEWSMAASYVARDHLTRLMATFERIPPAGPGHRLLDIGTLPAMLRLVGAACGYDVRGCNIGYSAPSRPIRFPPAAGFPETTLQIDSVDVECDRFPYENASFDVVLCCEVLEHLSRDPMHMLWEINRVLRLGGLLILTTPNIVSARSVRAVLDGYHPQLWAAYTRIGSTDRHNREYAPREVRWLLDGAGFSSDGVSTWNVWQDDDQRTMEELAALGAPTEDRGGDIVVVAKKVNRPRDRWPEPFYS